MSWFVDPEDLIIEVESRPLLYAKSLPEYASKFLKNDAWEDVAQNLSEDWDTLNNEEKQSRCRDVQLKWKHLRDNFRREHQAQKDASAGKCAKRRKKYRYYDDLLFLAPHVKDTQCSGNSRTTRSTTYKSEEDGENPLSPDIENSPGKPVIGPIVLQTSFKDEENASCCEEKVSKPCKCDETDEDKTFCLSLVQSLKRMDNDTKMSAKIEILSLIQKITKSSKEQSNQ